MTSEILFRCEGTDWSYPNTIVNHRGKFYWIIDATDRSVISVHKFRDAETADLAVARLKRRKQSAFWTIENAFLGEIEGVSYDEVLDHLDVSLALLLTGGITRDPDPTTDF